MSIKPVSGFGWIETVDGIAENVLNRISIKPVSGFGWIETCHRNILEYPLLTIKPVSGFGWIEICRDKAVPCLYIFRKSASTKSVLETLMSPKRFFYT